MIICGVYRIVNLFNGNGYIGSSNHIHRRYSNHKSRLRYQVHGNPYLQAAWNLYGEAAFSLEILEVVDNVSQLRAAEAKFVEKLKPEYNMAPVEGIETNGRTADGIVRMKTSNLGRKFSEEVRRRISLGKHGSVAVEQQLRRLHESNVGKKRSPETKAKMSAARKSWWAKQIKE